MPKSAAKPLDRGSLRPSTLTLKLGRWLEAHATGWGVLALPLVVLLLVGAAMLRWISA